MSKIFKGLEQLLEVAKALEERVGEGKVSTSFRVSTARASPQSAPRSVNGPGSTMRSEPKVGSRFEGPEKPSSEKSGPVPSAWAGIVPRLGGSKSTLRAISERVILPLQHPEVFQRLGITPSRGILLYGPPGTGKTLIARTLARDLDIPFFAIAGPELLSKFYGEPEARLRELFSHAKQKAPALIFIDEIDSLAPARSSVEGEVEKRIVAQLLTLMDGFEQNEQVFVIAATNRPEVIDPALRRPGRFDAEIAVAVPDTQERVEILEVLTERMPLSDKVDLKKISEMSPGFVGADLRALVYEAGLVALRKHRILHGLKNLNLLEVSELNFSEALEFLSPSSLRAVEIETPHISWDEIGGHEEPKRILQEVCEGLLDSQGLFAKFRVRQPTGVLLYGPPGTGKTLLSRCVASNVNANFICVNGPEILTKWVGASELAVRDLFLKARRAAPCVLFFDEIDVLAPARGSLSGDSGVLERVVGQLLTEIGNLQTKDKVFVLAATNRPEALDPALLRSGRFDLKIEIPLPDFISRKQILMVHNAERPVRGIELEDYARRSEGWTGADLALLSDQSALRAVQRARALGAFVEDELEISKLDFEEAFSILEKLNFKRRKDV